MMTRVFLSVSIIFLFIFASGEELDCKSINLTNVQILKKELDQGRQKKSCFAPGNPCFVEFHTGNGNNYKVRFHSPASSDIDTLGYSANCAGTDLASKQTVKLPPGCKLFISLANSSTECVCQDSRCDLYVDPLGPNVKGQNQKQDRPAK
jgi:hypothetical protein